MATHDTPYVAACTDCGVDTESDDPNELVAFYRRHTSVTGHDVVVDGESPVDATELTDVEAVIDALATHYDEGVPVGAIAVALAARGASVGETLAEIRSLRMRGTLYEPRADHLATF